MNRREDWIDHLWVAINEAVDRAPVFAYGSHDCCTFVARCVDAMTGSDLLADLQTRYTDKTSALRFIAEAGGFTEAVSSFLGQPEHGWPRRGDVVLVDTQDGPGVGVCIGPDVAVAHDGVALQPVTSGLVWRVG